MEIKEKVAIVTGGASGLGEATARRFIDAGARVAVFDMNNERGEALAHELNLQRHGAAIYVNTNVTDESSVQQGISDTLSVFKEIHICCNYAGVADAGKTIGKKGPFPLDTFKKVIDINLVGTFNVLRLAAEVMVSQSPVTADGGRGVIINTASIAAYEGQMGQAAYSASKGGIVGMTLPIARDLADHGIRVNAMAPGLIHTPMFDSFPQNVVDSLSNNVPFPKRLGSPDEIAHLAQFIVENDYLNGEVIRVDGATRLQAK